MTGGVTLSLPRGPVWPNSYALAPLTNKQSHPDGTLAVVVMNQTDKPQDFQLWIGGQAAKTTSAAHSIMTMVL